MPCRERTSTGTETAAWNAHTASRTPASSAESGTHPSGATAPSVIPSAHEARSVGPLGVAIADTGGSNRVHAPPRRSAVPGVVAHRRVRRRSAPVHRDHAARSAAARVTTGERPERPWERAQAAARQRLRPTCHVRLHRHNGATGSSSREARMSRRRTRRGTGDPPTDDTRRAAAAGRGKGVREPPPVDRGAGVDGALDDTVAGGERMRRRAVRVRHEAQGHPRSPHGWSCGGARRLGPLQLSVHPSPALSPRPTLPLLAWEPLRVR